MNSRKPIHPGDHIAITVKDINVYHTLRWCNRIRRDYHFTLDRYSVCGEAQALTDDTAMDNHFDARDLPECYRDHTRPTHWIMRAILDGFDLRTITVKNKPPRPSPTPLMASGLAIPPLDNGTEDFPF